MMENTRRRQGMTRTMMIVFMHMILMTPMTVMTKSMMAAAKTTMWFSKKLEVPAKKRKTMNKK